MFVLSLAYLNPPLPLQRGEFIRPLQLTIYHLSLTIYHLPLTIYHLPLTIYH